MKVLHLINTLSAGGAELHLLTLCRQLKRRDVEVVVAALHEQVGGSRSLRADFESAGVRVISFGSPSFVDPGFLRSAYKALKRERPDLLHTHLPRADFAGLARRLVSPRVPWVSSVHNVYGRYWSGRKVLPLLNLVWRSPDALIAISNAVAEWLQHARRVPADRVNIVYYGIEARRLDGPTADLRTEWDLGGRPVIGALGRLEPRKGHQTLIEAMPRVLEAVPEAVLLIAGHDPWGFGRELESRIGRLGLSRSVKMVGFQADVASYLQALDLFAFASVSEGFGQVLVEAMAAGKAVLASDIAPINEVVSDRETGILVEPTPEAFAEAAVALLNEPDRMRSMGKSGRKLVETRFSAERMGDETLAVYGSVLEQ